MRAAPGWKRFLAVGCSHGNLANPDALQAVLRFRDQWKPDLVAHLGDFIDTAAFRAGAKGTPDESEPVRPDFDCGLEFICDLRPQVVLCGNHEARLWRLRNHHNAIVSALAIELSDEIERECRKLKATLIPYRYKQAYQLADYKLMHGVYYNVTAARDHSEAFGNTIFAHTHRAQLDKGRRDDNPTGICVGTLADIPNMDYASTRRATLGWSGGFVWGVYKGGRLVPWLHEQPQEVKEWVLPI
jgi:predicted phosphodiesterase